MYWVILVFLLEGTTPVDVIQVSQEACVATAKELNNTYLYKAHCVLGGDI